VTLGITYKSNTMADVGSAVGESGVTQFESPGLPGLPSGRAILLFQNPWADRADLDFSN
jgi:hypothetical protein